VLKIATNGTAIFAIRHTAGSVHDSNNEHATTIANRSYCLSYTPLLIYTSFHNT